MQKSRNYGIRVHPGNELEYGSRVDQNNRLNIKYLLIKQSLCIKIKSPQILEL